MRAKPMYAVGVAARDPWRSGRFRRPGRSRPRAPTDWPRDGEGAHPQRGERPGTLPLDGRPAMYGPLAPPKPGPHYTVERIDQAIRVAHADLTWRSPSEQLVVWATIDHLLDRRNTITGRA